MRPDQSNVKACLKALAEALPGRIGVGEAVRRQHGNALTLIANEPPDAVVWPESTEEVAGIVRCAARFAMPLIGFGGGTSLEGHVNAPHGGISVDFSRMTKVLAVRPEDLDCTLEAGVTLDQLRQELKPTGLFFPVDPGSGAATLGGMAATRASGTTTVRYGSMRDNVLNLKVVLASGDIIETARRARKSASGYDLTRLFVGSEGTLGLITELTLKLHGVPESVVAAVSVYETVTHACDAAIAAMQTGLCVARMELLDAIQIRAVNRHSGLALNEAPTLFTEFHGSTGACREDLAAFEGLAKDNGAISVAAASNEDGRRVLWRARHDAFWAVKALWPGKEVLVTDVAVPLSRLASVVDATARDVDRTGLTAPILGHVGDGNFHCIVVLDPADAAERGRVEGFLERLVARALAADGTATGEHGIGQGKKRFMPAEHGSAVEVMRAVKSALDPLGLMNPGKIF